MCRIHTHVVFVKVSHDLLVPLVYTGASHPHAVATVPPGPKIEINPLIAA